MSEFPQASMLGNLLLSLVLIVGLIVGCIWLIKRLSNISAGGDRQLSVVCSLSLGARERVVLIQIGQQQVLVGVSPGRINTLQTFDEPVIATDSSGRSQSEFASQLANFLPGAR